MSCPYLYICTSIFMLPLFHLLPPNFWVCYFIFQYKHKNSNPLLSSLWASFKLHTTVSGLCVLRKKRLEHVREGGNVTVVMDRVLWVSSNHGAQTAIACGSEKTQGGLFQGFSKAQLVSYT
mmetsp:Transcript_30644/g.80032  ORF Transcript_30644/g.80032 Transcript_30644/m.80032 type:complete len:121 (+) Transcript_30644:2820-3182(+)